MRAQIVLVTNTSIDFAPRKGQITNKKKLAFEKGKQVRMVDGECNASIEVREGLSCCVKTYRRLLGAATWMRLDFKGTIVPLNAFRCIEMLLFFSILASNIVKYISREMLL